MIPKGFVALGYINSFAPHVHSNVKRPFVGNGDHRERYFRAGIQPLSAGIKVLEDKSCTSPEGDSTLLLPKRLFCLL